VTVVPLSPAYPCHPTRTVQVLADDTVPEEVVARTCPVCKRKWKVTRTTVRARVDSIRWDPA
jgi:hypothetical protein